MSDLISRSALLEQIKEAQVKLESNKDSVWERNKPYYKGLTWAHRLILDSLAVDAVEVVHGRWEKVIPTKSAAKWSTKVSCSICHKQGYAHHNYCPSCGAKMDGEKREPTMVTHEATLYRSCTCPSCKNVVDEYTEFAGTKIRVEAQWCRFCGQALKWEDDDD